MKQVGLLPLLRWSFFACKKGVQEQQHKTFRSYQGNFLDSQAETPTFSNVPENKTKPVEKHTCIEHIKAFLFAWDKLVMTSARCSFSSVFFANEFFKIRAKSIKCFYLLTGFSPLSHPRHIHVAGKF